MDQILGAAAAAEWKVQFMETSAKTNHNVTELFQELLNMEKNRNVSLQLDGKNKKKSKKSKKEQNGNTGDLGEGSSGGKEKCNLS
jgi:DIRAS family GTP-binding Ras-like protein 2